MTPKGGWRQKRDSFTKMITWFVDGNVRTWYSWDWKHRYSKKRDRSIGMARHRTRITKWGRLCRTAEIYDVLTGKLLHKFSEGREITDEQKE